METEKSIPVSVYAEMTPNPATMKFVADRLMIEGGEVVEYTHVEEAHGSSTFAVELFRFPFVKSVFIAANFVTVTKTDAVNWDMVTLELRQFVRDFMMENETLVQKVVPDSAAATEAKNPASAVPASLAVGETEEEQKIIDLLEEYVRPAVEGDGGAIHFKSYDQGVVTVTLKGACSGCPSSTATLKDGIENLLRSYLPDLKEVAAEEG